MKTLIIPALIAVALASSAAPASAYESPAIRGEAMKARVDQPQSGPVYVPVADGFHWGDAAVGAAGTAGSFAVALAGFALFRSTRRPATLR